MELKKAREALNLTQKEVAYKINITETQLRNIEHKRNKPSIETGLALAKLYNICPFLLFKDDDRCYNDFRYLK